METFVRNVRDLPPSDRSALERVVGHELRESQQLVIQVTSVSDEESARTLPVSGELPEWCNIYEGLSNQEIDELDGAVTRLNSSLVFQ
ncbi:MAG: hypothetical protein B7Z55_02275 [Planctomycetales bacterium 12-60-4]|nr:MAG: hypothetical protein B7Z55_02275 [Planctomycetales bacterium 12-60-4]